MLRVYPETPQLDACPKLDGFHKLSTLTLRGHMTQPQEQGKKKKQGLEALDLQLRPRGGRCRADGREPGLLLGFRGLLLFISGFRV